MFWTILIVAVMFVVLLLAEYVAMNRKVHSELVRKFLHITMGTFAATWPFFLSWGQIQVLSVIVFLGMVGSLKLNFWKSIHGVDRETYGEFLSVVTIGILAFAVHDPWIFAAAMLHISLADGLAAVTGVKWGKRNGYRIFGMHKSVVGTFTFLLVSMAIMTGYYAFSGAPWSLAGLLLLPVAATITENLSGRGFDNLTIPMLVALVLMHPF